MAPPEGGLTHVCMLGMCATPVDMTRGAEQEIQIQESCMREVMVHHKDGLTALAGSWGRVMAHHMHGPTCIQAKTGGCLLRAEARR